MQRPQSHESPFPIGASGFVAAAAARRIGAANSGHPHQKTALSHAAHICRPDTRYQDEHQGTTCRDLDKRWFTALSILSQDPRFVLHIRNRSRIQTAMTRAQAEVAFCACRIATGTTCIIQTYPSNGQMQIITRVVKYTNNI